MIESLTIERKEGEKVYKTTVAKKGGKITKIITSEDFERTYLQFKKNNERAGSSKKITFEVFPCGCISYDAICKRYIVQTNPYCEFYGTSRDLILCYSTMSDKKASIYETRGRFSQTLSRMKHVATFLLSEIGVRDSADPQEIAKKMVEYCISKNIPSSDTVVDISVIKNTNK